MILDEGQTDYISDSVGESEKNLVLISLKLKQKICLSLNYNGDEGLSLC